MKNNKEKTFLSNWKKGIEILKNDGVVVLPTDTLYGLTGKASSKRAVERIYEIKGRNENKPFIVLINCYKNLETFGIKIGEKEAKFLEKIWPGQASVILPCLLKEFEYIHRGTCSIAFRMIGKRNRNLYELINSVGPLVAPSVNPEGKDPAIIIKQAKKYFGDKVDLYIDVGVRVSEPSTLVKFESNDTWKILRQGKVIIDL